MLLEAVCNSLRSVYKGRCAEIRSLSTIRRGSVKNSVS